MLRLEKSDSIFCFFIVTLVSDLKCAQQVRWAVAPTLKASVAGSKSLYCSTAILSITKSCNCNKCSQEMSSQPLGCRSVSHRSVLWTELWHGVQPMVGPVILINTRHHRLLGSLISRLGCSQQSLSHFVAKWHCTSIAVYIYRQHYATPGTPVQCLKGAGWAEKLRGDKR